MFVASEFELVGPADADHIMDANVLVKSLRPHGHFAGGFQQPGTSFKGTVRDQDLTALGKGFHPRREIDVVPYHPVLPR